MCITPKMFLGPLHGKCHDCGSMPQSTFVMSECTALLGQRLSFRGVFGQWLQLMRCANLLAAGPSISIINVHEFGT